MVINLVELIRLYTVDTVDFQRTDGIWLDGKRIVLRSENVGDIVEARYQSPYCEARYTLSEADSEKMMLLLDADEDSLYYRLKEHFEGAAALDRFKQFCDCNDMKFKFDFIVNEDEPSQYMF